MRHNWILFVAAAAAASCGGGAHETETAPALAVPVQTVTVTTESLAVLITETVSEDWFATYSFVPLGVSAHPNGSVPTGMVLITFLWDVLITETVPLAMLVT